MKTYRILVEEADAALARTPEARTDVWELRREIAEALAREFPAVANAAAVAVSEQRGKKAVVTAAVAAILDLENPNVVENLQALAKATAWYVARPALRRLGFAGELMEKPQARGLRLPCAAMACPSSWGTNWGLPNTRAVAERLLKLAPAPVTHGNGWHLSPA